MSDRGAPIKVIANAVDLIEVLAARGAQSPAEIGEGIGIPRSSAYRLIDGLAAIQLVETLPDGRVRLSPRWLELADAARDAMTEWTGADAVLEHLVETTGLTAFLNVLVDDEAVCVDWRRGRGVDVMALKPGRALPLYAGAAGRVMLAYGVDVEEYLRRAPFPPLTPDTLVDPDALRADVAQTRARGYALSVQDVSVGIWAMGRPIYTPAGALAGCVSISGVASAFAGAEQRFADELAQAATALAGGFPATKRA